LKGKPIRIGKAADAIAWGLAYVPEDRCRHGVIPELPISSNVTLAILTRLSRGGSIDFAEETRIASQYLRRLRIKAPSLHTSVGTLSGGNQQKVALSRWLAANPSVLILDEPTQGIDIGAKAEIHALIGDLAAQGMAVLMISSELPEILGMSDRVAVMHEGRIVGVVDRAEATQEKILNLALGDSTPNRAMQPEHCQ
jgi:rhamnose transport system ATP-binding protein